MPVRRALVALPLSFTVACGGIAFFDPPVGEGGGGAASSSSMSSSSTGVPAQGGGGEGGTPIVGSRLVAVDYGELNAGTPLQFEITPETVGATVVVHAETPSGTLGVASLASPNQELLISGYNIAGTAWQFAWYGTTAAAIPQSESSSALPDPQPGLWTLGIGDPFGSATTGNVTVWRRETESGEFGGGILDVNVFMIAGLTTESYFDAMLAAAFDGYAGLQLGSVSYQVLDDDYAFVDETNYLAALEQTAPATLRPALNVLLVSDIGGVLDAAIGVSAGIPGLGVEHGSHSSGIIMEVNSDFSLDTVVVRHESGHLGGLFHTSEIDGDFYDALGDTPTCSDVMNMLLSCPDAPNIMFPVANPAAVTLSARQDRVIQGSTLYRGEIVQRRPADSAGGGSDDEGDARRAAAGLASHAQLGLAAARAKSWAPPIDPRAATLLQSHWCHQGRGSAAALFDKLGVGSEALLAIGESALAPEVARKRALVALGRRTLSLVQQRALARIAADASAPRAVRIGALRGLGRNGVRTHAAALRHDGDRLVAALARRLADR